MVLFSSSLSLYIYIYIYVCGECGDDKKAPSMLHIHWCHSIKANINTLTFVKSRAYGKKFKKNIIF